MNLLDKEIDIEYMSSNMLTGETTVTVAISKEVVAGVMQNVAKYKLSFAGETFSSTTDSKLLLAMQERLEALPEPV